MQPLHQMSRRQTCSPWTTSPPTDVSDYTSVPHLLTGPPIPRRVTGRQGSPPVGSTTTPTETNRQTCQRWKTLMPTSPTSKDDQPAMDSSSASSSGTFWPAPRNRHRRRRLEPPHLLPSSRCPPLAARPRRAVGLHCDTNTSPFLAPKNGTVVSVRT